MTAASIATIHMAMYTHANAINPQIASQMSRTYQTMIMLPWPELLGYGASFAYDDGVPKWLTNDAVAIYVTGGRKGSGVFPAQNLRAVFVLGSFDLELRRFFSPSFLFGFELCFAMTSGFAPRVRDPQRATLRSV
jgi:hypothetical protein